VHPVYYDLHIHSALSPCAASDMTPNDIVGMALLNGLDLIAVTDHNSLSNAAAIVKAAETANRKLSSNLMVLPGIEVSTVEEVHVLCLFAGIEPAAAFENELTPYFSGLSNRTDIFGSQIIYDEKDRIKGEVERMLIAPTLISFDDLYLLTHKFNGAFIPAHIDRTSFSVISNLGFLPPHLKINTLEISPNGVEHEFCDKNKDIVAKKNIITSSDAHQLWAIHERENFILLPGHTVEAAIDYLR